MDQDEQTREDIVKGIAGGIIGSPIAIIEIIDGVATEISRDIANMVMAMPLASVSKSADGFLWQNGHDIDAAREDEDGEAAEVRASDRYDYQRAIGAA